MQRSVQLSSQASLTLSFSDEPALPAPVTPKEETKTDISSSHDTATDTTEKEFEVVTKFTDQDQATEAVLEYTEYLHGLNGKYDSPQVLTVLKNLNRMHADMRSHRIYLAELLVQHNFPALAKTMLETYNRIGVFKSDAVWFPYYYTLQAVNMYSRVSHIFAKVVIESGIIQTLMLNLTHKPYIENKDSSNVRFVLLTSLSIISHVARHCLECRHQLLETNLPSVLLQFISDEEKEFRCMAIFTQAVLAIPLLEDSLSFLLSALCDAMSSKSKKYYGIMLTDLLLALSRLGMYDCLKDSNVDNDCPSGIVRVLESTSAEEKLQAANCLLSLCFDQKTLTKIKEVPNIQECLQKEINDPHQQLLHSAINHKIHEDSPNIQEMETEPHAVVGHSKTDKSVAKEIVTGLKSFGFKVQLLSEATGSSSITEIYQELFNASVVILCASEWLKFDPLCRAELEFAQHLGKSTISMIVPGNMTQGGWLQTIGEKSTCFKYTSQGGLIDVTLLLQKFMPSIDEESAFGVDPNARFPVLKTVDSLEHALALIPHYLEFLSSLNEFDSSDVSIVINNHYSISKRCFDNRGEIGTVLLQNGFTQIVKKFLAFFDVEDIVRNGGRLWSCFYIMLSFIWNIVDESKELSKDFVEEGIVTILIGYLTTNLIFKGYAHQRQDSLINASLSILHNIIRHYPEGKPIFRDNNAIQVLTTLLNKGAPGTKHMIIFILTLIMNEDEVANLDNNDTIQGVVDSIGFALASHFRRSADGLSIYELLEGLHGIAVNDNSKKKIADTLAVNYLVQILDSKEEDEQWMAARILWSLCFDDYSRQKVSDEENCIEKLKELQNHSSKNIQKAASGTLWKLHGETEHKNRTSESNVITDTVKDHKHIFISYNHTHKDVVLQVKDKLKKDGFNVWIDLEQMGGSTLETMALAVENAYLVLVCASENYKLSPNCRTEAEYTFQLKKPIIPLMMQRRYKPDGWLGMLMGAKLYINFDGKFTFDVAYKMLLKEMKPYTAPDIVDGLPKSSSQASVTYSSSQISKPVYETMSWSNEDVKKWMTEQHLIGLLNTELVLKLESMDGSLLVSLCQMRKEAPEFFYDKLFQMCQQDLLQLCKLTHALQELP